MGRYINTGLGIADKNHQIAFDETLYERLMRHLENALKKTGTVINEIYQNLVEFSQHEQTPEYQDTHKSNEEIRNENIARIVQHVDIIRTGSPMRIPKKSMVKAEYKKAGYSQVSYTWKRGDYEYIARWHTRTPKAPANQGITWVVERKRKGKGFGKNAKSKKHDVLSGKKWISFVEWSNSIKARRSRRITPKQDKILTDGHFPDLSGFTIK